MRFEVTAMWFYLTSLLPQVSCEEIIQYWLPYKTIYITYQFSTLLFVVNKAFLFFCTFFNFWTISIFQCPPPISVIHFPSSIRPIPRHLNFCTCFILTSSIRNSHLYLSLTTIHSVFIFTSVLLSRFPLISCLEVHILLWNYISLASCFLRLLEYCLAFTDI